MTLDDMIARKRIVICVGPGGVGKTSVAAALALQGARQGRKTLVCTIDPAKRLAASLGLPRLDHEERRVPPEKLAAELGGTRGELFAMMLDQKRAFDEFVARRLDAPERLHRIQENRIYQGISSSLTGAQEYAAMTKLHALDEAGRYDLLVLDTPPTSNALDFLDAPRRVGEAVESPALKWFTKPYESAGHFSLRLVSFGGAFVLRRIARFVGSAFIEDMAAFLVEFNEVIGGFGERAEQVYQLLREDRVAFVLVATPEPLAIDEAIFFYRELQQRGLPFGAFVLNRVHPSLGAAPSPDEVMIRMSLRPELRGFSASDLARASQALRRTYHDFEALAEASRRQVDRLAEACGAEHPYVRVPFSERDVYDVAGLAWLGEHLCPGGAPPDRAAAAGAVPGP